MGYETPRLIEFTLPLFGTALASDGVQWSAAVGSGADADTDVAVLTKTIQPISTGRGSAGPLISLELGLTAAFKAKNATADLKFLWQGRNKGGTWVDLHGTVTETDGGTPWVERTYSGDKDVSIANFGSVPFDVRLAMQANEADGGTAKVKSSSYVHGFYRPES